MKLFMLSLLALSASAAAFAGENGAHFDRVLTAGEMKKLLPEYVRYVEERASSIPSAEDNQRLRMLAAAIADPTQGTFRVQHDGSEELVGHQTYSVEEIIAQAEAEIAELKATSPAARQQQILNTLAGFKGAREAGKLSCRLGYFSPGKHPIDRIVKCTDDRSRAGRNGEEGFSDEREFTLSVEEKSLAPVGVISIEHFTAG